MDNKELAKALLEKFEGVELAMGEIIEFDLKIKMFCDKRRFFNDDPARIMEEMLEEVKRTFRGRVEDYAYALCSIVKKHNLNRQVESEISKLHARKPLSELKGTPSRDILLISSEGERVNYEVGYYESVDDVVSVRNDFQLPLDNKDYKYMEIPR